MKFRYQKIPSTNPGEPWEPLPLVPIRVINTNNDKMVECFALLDSGAEKSIFHVAIANELGINLARAIDENFSGLEGGRVPAKVINISIQVVGDAELVKIPIGFVKNLAFAGILGQEGFFDRYKISFIRSRLQIELN